MSGSQQSQWKMQKCLMFTVSCGHQSGCYKSIMIPMIFYNHKFTIVWILWTFVCSNKIIETKFNNIKVHFITLIELKFNCD